MREKIIPLLYKASKKLKLGLTKEQINSSLEKPPKSELGDYAFPCFSISEKLKMSPHDAALELRGKIGNTPVMDFENINVNGPYINFFFNRKELARKIVYEVLTKRHEYGQKKQPIRKKIVVEFSSPNIAKPFGIGHLRSTIIGNAIANICEKNGFKVKRISYPGDWGTQFGKLIYGFKKWGNYEKLSENPIKYLEKLYVKVNSDPANDAPSRREFKKLEEGDKENIALWRIFKEESMDEFEKIYKLFGIKFDEYLPESIYQKKMKLVKSELQEKNLIEVSEGALIINLEIFNLGKALVQKADGATLYLTRDLASAIDRYKKYKFHRMIYEVGQDQILHFQQLFKILRLMGYEWADNCTHVSHGMYLDTDRKKFATRKGKTVYMEDVLNKTKTLARTQIKKRSPNLSEEELEERSLKVAIAAIFYGDLKNNLKNNIIFDIKKFVSFEGNTGPYLQYSYARASSILKKIKTDKKFSIPNLRDEEIELIKKLEKFPYVIEKAYETLSPSVVANYAFELSKLFNEFYHECPVIGESEETFRLALVDSFRQVLKNSVDILGIPILEEM